MTEEFKIEVSDIISNRFQYGVNIGSWFILEKWLTPHMFESNSTGDSELDAVKAAVINHNADWAKEKWEKHWKEFMSKEDWDWLQEAGVNSIRIPFGYWIVGNGEFAINEFAEYKRVYFNAWKIFKDVISEANKRNIGVLVDLHGVPGGANTDCHSGTSNGKAAFFHSNAFSLFTLSKNQRDTLKIISYIADDLNKSNLLDSLIGIQVINEPKYGEDLTKWYDECIKIIALKAPKTKIYIGDSWNINKYSEYAKNRPRVMVDSHYYRTFSDSDRNLSPQQIIDSIDLNQNTNVIIGEYSVAIDGRSWAKAPSNKRSELVNKFAQKQFTEFRAKTSGMYFWTYRLDPSIGIDWRFKENVESGGLPRLPTNPDSIPSDEERDDRIDKITNSHINYWNSNSREKMEHWRYKTGATHGWEDAKQFWQFHCSVIGQLERWKNMRFEQHKEATDKSSSFLWEYEHGFLAGVEEFRKAVHSY